MEGTVVRLAPFGAFIEFEPNVIGLCLVPETLAEPGQGPSDVMQIGDVVKVVILYIDETRERMSVSQRRLLNAEP